MKRLPAIHPLLFGLFPVLFLYAQNANEMPLDDLWTPLFYAGGAAIALTIVFSLLLWNLNKGALISSAVVVLFLSFGHITRVVPPFKMELGESVLGPSLLVLIGSAAIVFVLLLFAFITRRKLDNLTSVLSWLGIILVLMQVVHGGSILITRDNSDMIQEAAIPSNCPTGRLPDIYYIMIDGYGRSDILRELYGFDNSDFIEHLRKLGYSVADSSYANYPQTVLCMNSIFYMDYLEDMPQFTPSKRGRPALAAAMQKNTVFNFLRDHGYKIVSFPVGFSYAEMKGIDTLISPVWSASEFYCMLMATTPLPLFSGGEQSPCALHRHRVSYVLDKLSNLDGVGSPKLVYAHILSPHPPFLFDADGDAIMPEPRWSLNDGSHRIGNATHREEYVKGYREQVEYMTERLKDLVEDVIDVPEDEKPIVILQSDHGPGSGLNWESPEETNLRERFAILNALYLPDLEVDPVYDDLSPVNSFRIVLDNYFGTDLGLLPDRHSFALFSRPFELTPITAELSESAYRHLEEQLERQTADTLVTQ